MSRPIVLMQFGPGVTLLLPDGNTLTVGRPIPSQAGVSGTVFGFRITLDGRFSDEAMRVLATLLDFEERGRRHLLFEEIAPFAFPALNLSAAERAYHTHIDATRTRGLVVQAQDGTLALNQAYRWTADALDLARYVHHGATGPLLHPEAVTGSSSSLLQTAIELQQRGQPRNAWAFLHPLLAKADSDDERLAVLPVLASLAVELGRHRAARDFLRRIAALTKRRPGHDAACLALRLSAVLELQRRNIASASQLADKARDILSVKKLGEAGYRDHLIGSCWLRSEICQRKLLRDAPAIDWTEKQSLREAQRFLLEGQKAAVRLGRKDRLAEVPFRKALLALRLNSPTGLTSNTVAEAKALQQDLSYIWASVLDRVLLQRSLCDATDPGEVEVTARTLIEHTQRVADRGFAGQVVRAQASMSRSRHFRAAADQRARIATAAREESSAKLAEQFSVDLNDVEALRAHPTLGAESVFEAPTGHQVKILEQQIREMRVDLALYAAGHRA